MAEPVNYLLKRIDNGFSFYSLDDLRKMDARERNGLHKYEFIVGFPTGFDTKTESFEDITDLHKAVEQSLKEQEKYLQLIGDEMTDLVITTYEIDLFPTLRETYQNYLTEYTLRKESKVKYVLDPGRRELITFALAYVVHREGLDEAFVKILTEGEVNFREANFDLKMRMEKLNRELRLLDFDVKSMRWTPIKFSSFNEFDRRVRSLISTYKSRYQIRNQPSLILKAASDTLEEILEEKYD